MEKNTGKVREKSGNGKVGTLCKVAPRDPQSASGIRPQRYVILRP